MRPGDPVVHPRFGPGAVIAIVAGGRARVRFFNQPALPRTVPIAELAPNGQQAIATPTASLRVAPPPPMGEEQVRLRQVIEALRLGVVPSSHLKDYTVGRDRSLQQVEEMFVRGQGMQLVFADYGVGKTHFLDLVEQQALASGFLTSRITLDIHETPLSHPQRLWRSIVCSLRYPGEGGQGIVPLFERLRHSLDHAHPKGEQFHRFLSPALWAFHRGDGDEWGWLQDYIEGYPMEPADVNRVLRRLGWPGERALALSDFRTYGRMYVYMVGGLASWAKDAGFRGLCLLFDEAEHVGSLDSRQVALAEEVIRHYAAATLPLEELVFDPEQLYRGGHEVHRALPLQHRPDQPLVVLVALTPEPAILEMCAQMVRKRGIELEPLSARERRELVKRLTRLYQKAYGLQGSPEYVLSRPPEWYQSPRELVRELIAKLDDLRYTEP